MRQMFTLIELNMLCAVDVGNTNIVVAVYDGDVQCDYQRIETSGDVLTLFSELYKKHPHISSVIVSSVVPDVNEVLQNASEKAFDFPPLFVDWQNIGVKIDLEKPEEVGADRLVNAVSLIKQYQSPAIIIDFGTATTFDVVNAEGCYCGGVIAPGINLSLEALHMAAAKLPNVPIEKPKNVIGKNTVQAMKSGLYWGYIGMVEGTVQRLSVEMNVKPFVIATGGLAPLLSEGTDVIEMTDQNLTMNGLKAIYQTRKEKK